jgi:predicted CXXCH cytochrome family protein
MLCIVGLAIALGPANTQMVFDPHGDPDTGVRRLAEEDAPRGECGQCHPSHEDPVTGEPAPTTLFTDNTNELAYWDSGIEPCHGLRPSNYPLGENDRIPESEPNAGYFEANVGGVRRPGVDLRGRWPGQFIYTNPAQTPDGHWISPHAWDPDMPRVDTGGEGLCLNCHEPHGTAYPDLLTEQYGGIGGSGSAGPPPQYQMCFSCHSIDGPAGMDLENQTIADYYDAGLNGVSAGHQIRFNLAVAISWPSYMQPGDMLPCYECHNPHGSAGYDGARPNGYLISDHRQGWSGLTDTKGDPAQSRRFCLGCHISSDGVPGSQIVSGIVMNTLSIGSGHASTDNQGCWACHGRDYDTPTSHNVHNPAPQPGQGGPPDFTEQ